MLRLGLTGGIASGKSAVAAMLRELGFSVLDADALAHKLIEPGQPLERLAGRGMREDEARRRIAAQMPVEEKLRYATEKIDCSGTLDETRQQVEALAAKLHRSKAAQ